MVDLKPKEIYKYVVIPENLKRKIPLVGLISALKEMLDPMGYEIIWPNASVRIRSGASLRFDAIIREKGKDHLIAVLEFLMDEPLDDERIMAFIAGAVKAGSKHAIMIYQGNPDSSVKIIASRFGIRLIGLTSPEKTAEEILRILSSG